MISTTSGKAFYDAERHAILSGPDTPLKRWHWLAVITDRQEADNIVLSDFFCDLRVSANLSITDKEAMHLFACQKGWLPEGDMDVVLRNGFVEHIAILHRSRSTEEIGQLVSSLNILK